MAAVYRQLLGRTPTDGELDMHANVASLEEILAMALASEEYAERLRMRRAAAAQAVANVYHPDLADWGLPPGTRSEDGVAIVGREGWLFLCGGNNDPVGQYTGTLDLGGDWERGWEAVLRQRRDAAAELGLELAMLVIPEKLTVLERHFPEPVTRTAAAPPERLRRIGAPLLFPREELREADLRSDVFLRTDTHLDFHGNAVVAAVALRALGAPVPPPPPPQELHTAPYSGDLGTRFEPAIVGARTGPTDLGQATLAASNWAEIAAVGGNLGTRQVFSNERAPDRRKLVVFGGSSSVASATVPGLCWFLAQAFREVHFVWFPFGWDSAYLRRVGADAVLVQTGERMLARVPRLEVDTAALAADTLRDGRPAGPERILQPRE